MNDLIKLLRGRRIDGRSADEIMRLAADEIESLRSRLAEAEKDATRSRHEWQRECEDTDLLLQGMGLCPSEYRSECGSLLLARIRHKMGHIGLRLDETLARLAELQDWAHTESLNTVRLNALLRDLRPMVVYKEDALGWGEKERDVWRRYNAAIGRQP